MTVIQLNFEPPLRRRLQRLARLSRQVIPAVIYGALANVSIGAVFLGSIIPGFIMAAGMMALIVILSHMNNYPVHARAKFSELTRALKRRFFPLLTPIIIDGGILSGVFTPTEAAGIALFMRS